ncbi:MAG TPA: hypothetical protein VKX30_02595 [Flavobacteriaceae bacterium]|nr:hypothetical protein [Flavobacteriaceae bacterium]
MKRKKRQNPFVATQPSNLKPKNVHASHSQAPRITLFESQISG